MAKFDHNWVRRKHATAMQHQLFFWGGGICFVTSNKSETYDDPVMHSSVVHKDVILHINNTQLPHAASVQSRICASHSAVTFNISGAKSTAS